MNTWNSRAGKSGAFIVAGNINRAGCKLLADIASNLAAGNIFMSPYSLSTAMAIVYGGAVRETAKEFSQVFGFGKVEELNENYWHLISSVNKCSDHNVLRSANSIWVGRTFAPRLNGSFVNQAEESFGAAIYTVDFNSPDTAGQINQWVSESTGGKIPDIIDDTSGLEAAIINAIYFAGMWKERFDKAQTKPSVFWVDGVNQTDCLMMNKTDEFLYSEDDKAQTIFLPYLDSAEKTDPLAMAIILPKAGHTMLDCLPNLENIFSIKENSKQIEVQFSMPRFSVSFDGELVNNYKNLGLLRAFDPKNAQFDNLCHGLYISTVIHKALLEIKEEGTTAAAASFTGMMLGCASPPEPNPVVMTVNRPFILAILEPVSKTPLFIGGITKPEPLVR